MDRRTASRWQWLAARLCAAVLPLLLAPQPALHAAPPETLPDKLPAPRPSDPAPTVSSDHKVMPISLDAVMHLTEERNLQIGQARAKVAEAQARLDLIGKGCLHPVQKVNAERKYWQYRTELSRTTAETILEAASTYIDLLAAQAGHAIVLQTEKELSPLLERAQKLAATEPGAQAEVARIRAEIAGSKQDARNLAVQAAAANAKLVYLLAFDPCTELVPDCSLAPINLMDVRLPCCELVAMALSQGPGVQEMGQMVAVIDAALEKSHGLAREPHGSQAKTGAEPDETASQCASLLGRVSSSVTNVLHMAARRELASAEQAQAHFAYDDLKAKLAAGVQEAYETILGSSEQIRHGTNRVTNALEARKLSQDRLFDNIPGSSYTEVLLSVQALTLAQIKYVAAIRDYDKAQLRLLILTGSCHGSAPSLHPVQESVPADPDKASALPEKVPPLHELK